LKEHAWKAISARRTERHQSTSPRNRVNDLPLKMLLDVTP